ncbi:hypothetical protein BC628DRAFT_961153 [Trametes gibbosa]|nr:hypothetical protein BC628DRAFT_961153 [Trametes gibbosa]
MLVPDVHHRRPSSSSSSSPRPRPSIILYLIRVLAPIMRYDPARYDHGARCHLAKASPFGGEHTTAQAAVLALQGSDAPASRRAPHTTPNQPSYFPVRTLGQSTQDTSCLRVHRSMALLRCASRSRRTTGPGTRARAWSCTRSGTT